MTDEANRRAISAATLAVMAVATLVMAVWGYHALTSPVAKSDPVTTRSDTPACTGSRGKVQRSDVTVSVFNAGSRAGRAQSTLDLLENAGFRAGAVGNAPAGSHVSRAEVHTTRAGDPQARLVALALGAHTRVVVAPVVGPGLDVLVGDKFKKLDAGAPRSVPAAASSC
jgi:hypothetical protein